MGEAAVLERTLSVFMIVGLVLLIIGTIFVHSPFALFLCIPAILYPLFFLSLAVPEPAPEAPAKPAQSAPAKPVTRQAAPAKPATEPAQPDKPVGTQTSKAASTLPDGWYVQVGSFSQSDNAGRLRDRLKTGGMEAYVQTASTDKGASYRVVVGPSSTRPQAEQLQQVLITAQNLKGIVVELSSAGGG